METALIVLLVLSIPAAAVGGVWMLWHLAVTSEPQYYVRAPGPAAEPKCPRCGYNVYFAENQRCPECGRTFDIKELDMRMAVWDGHVLRPRQPEDKT